MKATTIKLEGELLERIEQAKPPSQSVTAYVRSVLRKDLDRMQLREAAVEYRAFVDSHPEEKAWIEAWDRADLGVPPAEPPGGVMKRGAIFWVHLGSSHPPEFGETRPGLVISNTAQNEILDSVVVVPLSTNPGEIWPLRLAVGILAGRASFAVLPGLRQVSKQRLSDFIAMAPSDWIPRLDHALSLYLLD